MGSTGTSSEGRTMFMPGRAQNPMDWPSRMINSGLSPHSGHLKASGQGCSIATNILPRMLMYWRHMAKDFLVAEK